MPSSRRGSPYYSLGVDDVPKVHISPEAAAELRKRIVEYPDPAAFVVVFRRPKQGDLKRGPDGEALWTINEPSQKWGCEILAIPEEVKSMGAIPAWSVVDVDGVPFGMSTCKSDQTPEIWIRLRNGDLHVEAADA
jgi:hypothetical protein